MGEAGRRPGQGAVSTVPDDRRLRAPLPEIGRTLGGKRWPTGPVTQPPRPAHDGVPIEGVAQGCSPNGGAVAVSPFLVWHKLWSLVIGPEPRLEGSSEALSLLPGLAGQYIRCAFLAWTLAECPPTAVIGFGVLFSKVGARIGPNVYIGPRRHIGLAYIERDALLAVGVHVTSGARTHGIDDSSRPIREQPGSAMPVRVGAGLGLASPLLLWPMWDGNRWWGGGGGDQAAARLRRGGRDSGPRASPESS